MATKPEQRKPRQTEDAGFEDTAMLSLSQTDRKKLGMDAWEPSSYNFV